MSMGTHSLTERVARGWVALYTLGVSPSLREARRAEINSDLWEQRHEETGSNDGSTGSVLARVLGGLPADVAWAIDVRHQEGGSLVMGAFDGYGRTEKVVITGIAVVAAFLASIAIGAPPLAVLIALITAFGIAAVLRMVLPPTTGGAMDTSARRNRRGRLLATFVISILVIVGIGSYIFSLDHWGGLAFSLNLVGVGAMAVALGSLIMFVADLVRGRHPASS